MNKEQKRRYIKHFISLSAIGIFRIAGIRKENFYAGRPISDEKLDKAIEVIKNHIKELDEIEKEG